MRVKPKPAVCQAVMYTNHEILPIGSLIKQSGLILNQIKMFIHRKGFENGICKIQASFLGVNMLTHWGRATHICVSKPTISVSGNGLSPGRRQAIIRTNAGVLLIGLLGTNFSEFLIEIHIFSFKKMSLKMSSAKNGVNFLSGSKC